MCYLVITYKTLLYKPLNQWSPHYLKTSASLSVQSRVGSCLCMFCLARPVSMHGDWQIVMYSAHLPTELGLHSLFNDVCYITSWIINWNRNICILLVINFLQYFKLTFIWHLPVIHLLICHYFCQAGIWLVMYRFPLVSISNVNASDLRHCNDKMYFYTPPTKKLLGGILVSLCPSVCPSVRPSVPHPVSAL